jgi:hypothetical protein
MKKNFLGLSALLLAVVFSSFTMFAPLEFRYTPADEVEVNFETATSWQQSPPTHPSCTGGNDVCIIRIDDSELAPFSGNNVQKLASYMASQGPGQDFADATTAANALAIAQKP